MGVKAGYDAAKERCKEEIELLKFLLPANSGNIEKDLIFLALHRGYKQQKAARALSRETIALVKEAAAQKRGKAYEERVWRDLCNAKELNEWPLRPYGDSLNTLTGNMSRVADYIKILKAEMAAYPQITETSFEQKIKNMLSKGGDWLEDITKGIGAIITEWRGIKKEEDKKIEQRAVQKKFPKHENIAAAPINVSNHQNTYWKMAAQDPISDDLKRKVDKLVSYLIAYYQTHGQINKINTLRNNPLELTSVKIRPLKEQTGYIFDVYQDHKIKKHDSQGQELSYYNFRLELDAYYKDNPDISKDKVSAHKFLQEKYEKRGGLEQEYYNRKLYHVKGNAVDIRINNPFTKDIETLFTKDLMDPNIERNWFNGVVSLAKIHDVGEGPHLHISF